MFDLTRWSIAARNVYKNDAGYWVSDPYCDEPWYFDSKEEAKKFFDDCKKRLQDDFNREHVSGSCGSLKRFHERKGVGYELCEITSENEIDYSDNYWSGYEVLDYCEFTADDFLRLEAIKEKEKEL